MIEEVSKELSFYRGKKVLITGHTGFKGSWMCKILLMLGAAVTGYALEAPTTPSLFKLLGLEKKMDSVIGNICDLQSLQFTFARVQPEIVIHMAAQPIVREAYRNPVDTYATNVMGTVNILECIRNTDSVRSFVNVTTDKVYLNKEWEWGYRESDELNGYDPYSNSKSCSELVTSSYKKSFFEDGRVAISTMRAGNVIGGGDFAAERIIPDCVRAAMNEQDIIVRNPYSIRPYQHVLEPIMAYLMVAMRQYEDRLFAGNYNIGPDDRDCWETGKLVDYFCNEWELQTGYRPKWIKQYDGGPHEANYLKLDCSKIKRKLNWQPICNGEEMVKKTVEWYNAYACAKDIEACMESQISRYWK